MKYARANVIGEDIIDIFFSPLNFQFLFCTLGFQTLLRKKFARKGHKIVLDDNIFLICSKLKPVLTKT